MHVHTYIHTCTHGKSTHICSHCFYVFVQVKGASDFEWVKNLRYYWDPEIDDCVVRMSNSRYVYGYEYLGASPRLVITPLTVRGGRTSTSRPCLTQFFGTGFARF